MAKPTCAVLLSVCDFNRNITVTHIDILATQPIMIVTAHRGRRSAYYSPPAAYRAQRSTSVAVQYSIVQSKWKARATIRDIAKLYTEPEIERIRRLSCDTSKPR